jgi:carbon storage regulator
MLVIKRKVSESILIGEDIEIIVTGISNDKVNIAINAPKDIKIIRKELADTCEFNIIASEKINKTILADIKNKLRNL